MHGPQGQFTRKAARGMAISEIAERKKSGLRVKWLRTNSEQKEKLVKIPNAHGERKESEQSEWHKWEREGKAAMH